MYKLVALLFVVASASAAILPLGGYAAAPYPYAAAPALAAAPLHYAAAPALAAAPVLPAAPVNYALPPTQVIEEQPIVETLAEPVEQWGYKIAY